MRVVNSPSERRRHARVAVRLPAALMLVTGRATGEVIDLSQSGCRVATDARLVEGDRLRVALDLGGGAGAVPCEAIVARVPGAGQVALSLGGFEGDGEARLAGVLASRPAPGGGRDHPRHDAALVPRLHVGSRLLSGP